MKLIMIQTQGKANERMDQASLFVVSQWALGGSVTPFQDCGEQQCNDDDSDDDDGVDNDDDVHISFCVHVTSVTSDLLGLSEGEFQKKVYPGKRQL